MEKMGRVLLFTLIFWNLENYYDPFIDDTGNEYTPKGEKHWSWKKFCSKRDLISKIIISTRDVYSVYPSIIGVCEVENIFVLKQLITQTPLNSLGYKILHKNSIDKRGIDVALLYRQSEVAILKENYFPSKEWLETHNLQTRYILYTKCVIKETNDTLHIFVNHWPSKLGDRKVSNNGEKFSARISIAMQVRKRCDSILKTNPNARIILMGDFNDTPDSESIKYLCGEGYKTEESILPLINLAATQSQHSWGIGSYKFKESWEAIDQFIVSDSIGMKMSVFTHNALLIQDKKFLGKQISRTHKGPRYSGGASDHLPILLTIKYPLN